MKRFMGVFALVLSLLAFSSPVMAQYDNPPGCIVSTDRYIDLSGDIHLIWVVRADPAYPNSATFQQQSRLLFSTFGGYYDLSMQNKPTPQAPEANIGFVTEAVPGGMYQGQQVQVYVYTADITAHNPRLSPWIGTGFGKIRTDFPVYNTLYRAGTHALALFPLTPAGRSSDIRAIELIEGL